MPYVLDLVGGLAAEFGRGEFGETCGGTDPQRPGDQFQQRPAPSLVERIEKSGQDFRQVDLAGRRQGMHDFGKRQSGMRKSGKRFSGAIKFTQIA